VRALVETIVERAGQDVIVVRITAPDGRALALELTRDECMQLSNHLGGAIAYLWTPTEVVL
jgi:hypothetical protein